jgi:hypothetical protein
VTLKHAKVCLQFLREQTKTSPQAEKQKTAKYVPICMRIVLGGDLKMVQVICAMPYILLVQSVLSLILFISKTQCHILTRWG